MTLYHGSTIDIAKVDLTLSKPNKGRKAMPQLFLYNRSEVQGGSECRD
jgi:hypothetical protein